MRLFLMTIGYVIALWGLGWLALGLVLVVWDCVTREAHR